MDATTEPRLGDKTRPQRTGDRHSIQSVDRALMLLETIADAGGEATLTDLSHRTGLNISTCHHLLATLIQRGFAAKVTGRRLYRLGSRILYLGHACLQVDLPRPRASPIWRRSTARPARLVHLAGAAGRLRRHGGGARRTPPVRVTPARYRQAGSPACHLDRQGHARLAARG